MACPYCDDETAYVVEATEVCRNHVGNLVRELAIDDTMPITVTIVLPVEEVPGE